MSQAGRIIRRLQGKRGSASQSQNVEQKERNQQQWQPLGDGRWGRVVGREGSERSVGRCHGVWKGILYFYSCEPYSTSNKTEY